ncbi:biotin synthase [Roseateles oligotrophus]|uniref:Biotin synthase n=1 Tax=Roseateles oligotrophus TaxID=1769250 RepID=A0ABT2YE24_9BURK|nr:biotin synthase [Roseateles oligotrophus]MCV2368298.1 biotin synthase [Roseateles oligotrophus]
MSASSSPPKNEAAGPREVDAAALARHMRRLAQAETPPWLHLEVATRMAERLPIIKLQPRRVLQWSAFLGAAGALLGTTYPQAEQVCVEPSALLLARSEAGQKRAWWQALRGDAVVAVEAAEAVASGRAELVWANMCLHINTDLPAALAAWHAALAVDGFVMFSCLGPDSFVELRPIFERMAWGKTAPEWWDMHDIGDVMVGVGFADPVMDQERITLTWSDGNALLRDLRALGGNMAPTRFKGLRGRAWRQKLLNELESLRAADGRLRLSLEVVYGHAFKPKPRVQLTAETSFSLEEMRAMVRRSGA